MTGEARTLAKRTAYLVVLLLLVGVIAFGSFQAWVVVSERDRLAHIGTRSEATITAVSKGKCGLGYGYSATFTFNHKGRTLTGSCECESRSWVKPGERYLAAFDPVHPQNVLLLVDSGIVR
jgi:hypothetical protein